MSDSLENILKDTYDKDKLDSWFKTNETKLLNDLNNCNKKIIFLFRNRRILNIKKIF